MRASDRSLLAVSALVATLVLIAAPARAQDDPDARLRAALRSATVQLRQLEDQNANLQAKQAQSDREKLQLTQQLAATQDELSQLRQQNKTAQDSAQQLTQKLQAAGGAIEAERGSLARLQTQYQQTTAAAQRRDTEAKQLDTSLVETRRRLLACNDKNAALYQLGLNILDTYEHKGALSTLLSNERVTGLRRVELENLVQDYQDKLYDNKIIPGVTDRSEAPPAATQPDNGGQKLVAPASSGR